MNCATCLLGTYFFSPSSFPGLQTQSLGIPVAEESSCVKCFAICRCMPNFVSAPCTLIPLLSNIDGTSTTADAADCKSDLKC